MLRGARPLMVVLGTTLLHGTLHAQDGRAPFPAAVTTAPTVTSRMPPSRTGPETAPKKPAPRTSMSGAAPKAHGFRFRKAEAGNALAMRWICVGCTAQKRPRPDPDDRSGRSNLPDEPAILDPAQAPVIE